MKKLIIFFSLFAFLNVFGQVIDNENYFSKDDISEIQKEIDSVKNSKSIRVIINTSKSGEGIVVDNPVKTVIVNIKKGNGGNLQVATSFSQDLNMEDREEQLSALQNELEQYVKKNELGLYVVEYIKGIDSLVTEEDSEPEMTFLEKIYDNRWLLIKIVVILLTIINILVRIKHVSDEKKRRLSENIEKK